MISGPKVSPSRDAQITLQEITKETLRPILDLSVREDQGQFVAPNSVSIAQAHFEPNHAWFRAIYADDAPVGFVMLYDDSEKPEYFLWRFMIDARHQGLGFGKRAIEVLIEHVRSRPNATQLLVSCVPGKGSPCPFYEHLGFEYTGEVEHGEKVLRLDL